MGTETAFLQRPDEETELVGDSLDPVHSVFSNRRGLYLTFWLLVPLILPTCAFLYALPLAPVIWLAAKVAGTATSNHGGTIVAIIMATSLALAAVTVGTLWKRTRLMARSLR